MRWYTGLFALIVFIASLLLLPHGGSDWYATFMPAARHGWSAPWEHGVPSPPYAALMLYPVALLPSCWGTALVNGLSVLVLARLAGRGGGAEWVILLVLASPVGACLFLCGQIDVLILAGVLLPESLGALVYTLKPQVGLWIVVARWKRLLGRPLVIMGIAGLVSLLIWGWWPGQMMDFAAMLIPAVWNASLWPYLAPMGVWCVWRAWRTQDERYGIMASPLLFPYVSIQSYVGLLTIVAVRWPRWAVLVW